MAQAKTDPNLTNKLAVADKAEPGKPALQQMIEMNLPEIRRALPDVGITPERFTRILLTEIRRNPSLAKCNPVSIIASAMVAAQLGLEIGGPLGHAYLVPYKGEATFILGYKGIIDLARRSGQIKSIVARAVHEHDDFDYGYGLDEYLTHKPAVGDRGETIAYYGIAKFKDGGHQMLVMSKADVDKRKARSASAKSGRSPWDTDYDAMACKTVIRAMAPFLPLEAEHFSAIAVDGASPRRIDFDLTDLAYEADDPAGELEPGDDDPVEAVVVDANGEPIQQTLEGEQR